MTENSSNCIDHFGHADFDIERIGSTYPRSCPVKNCAAKPETLLFGRSRIPVCREHGLRLHSNTFVYWNGAGEAGNTTARLRNFVVRPDLAAKIALGSVAKAENYRLGYELSEDALTWNVFVAIAEAGKLRGAAEFLTGRAVDAEPALYLWGELIDVRGRRRGVFNRLDVARDLLERDIRRFRTEPDVMLVIDDRLVVCIEAKFGSGNPLAFDATVEGGSKPMDRDGLLARYLDRSGPLTRAVIDRNQVGPRMHSQLFRNVVFAAEMANSADWHVVNLVSSTQWQRQTRSELRHHSYQDPTQDVVAYLKPGYENRFSFRTWEGLYQRVIRTDGEFAHLAAYMESKSAHYRRAFSLESAPV